MNNIKRITTCEVCGNGDIQSVLNLGSHPLCDDLVPIGKAEVCTEYPIEIMYCSNCNTAHQAIQVEKKLLFPPTYHYRARFTADVLDGMAEFVDACELRLGSLEGKKVLDVGCNDTSLLGFFKARGALTIGLEPTSAIKDAPTGDHVLYNDFFNKDSAKKILAEQGSLDIISFTNVFAHIEDLNGLLESLSIIMSPATILVVENHYLGSILKNSQFDTFYHEHPRTYSLNSFHQIAKTMDLSVLSTEFPARYGGNIRVFIGDSEVNKVAEDKSYKDILEQEGEFLGQLLNMQTSMEAWKVSKNEEISALVKKYGPLKAKAFPGRAAIFIKLLGLDVSSIECVYEKPGSMKIGHYLPGTRIPIKSDDELFSLTEEPPVIMNMAWHISSEIHSFLKKKGFTGHILDIYNPKDMDL